MTKAISRLSLGRSAGMRRIGCPYLTTRSFAQLLHLQRIDPSFVRLDDSKLEPAEMDFFATAGQATEFVHDKAADRVVLLVVEFAFEVLIEVLDAGQRPDREAGPAVAVTVGPDELGFLVVMLVLASNRGSGCAWSRRDPTAALMR